VTQLRPTTRVLAAETRYGLRPNTGSVHDYQLREPVVMRSTDDYRLAQLTCVRRTVTTEQMNSMDSIDPERMSRRVPVTSADRLSAKQFLDQ